MKVGEYVKTGWALFKKYPGGFIGFTLLSMVLTFALDYLPYLGSLINFAIAMPLQVGPLIVAFRLLQGKNSEFQEFFSGFHYFVPLLLMSLVVTVIILLSAIPFAAAFFLMIGEAAAGRGLIILVSLFVVVIVFIMAIYLFAPMVVADRRLDFWPALELSRTTVQRNILGVLGFLGLLFLICLAGVLCLGVGLLVAIPVANCALAAAFADIFGLRSSEY